MKINALIAFITSLFMGNSLAPYPNLTEMAVQVLPPAISSSPSTLDELIKLLFATLSAIITTLIIAVCRARWPTLFIPKTKINHYISRYRRK